MEHRPGFSTLSASYNDFLFATVCDEANGMRLSMLSALARINVDPWEEATRLAAMPKAIAERTLVAILDLASGRSWNAPEAEATAARLVRLLPDPSQATTMAAGLANGQTATGQSAKTAAQRATYWWVWIGFALMMSFMTPHHEAATTSPGMALSETSAPATIQTTATAVPSNVSAPAPLNVSAPAPLKSKNLVPDPVDFSR